MLTACWSIKGGAGTTVVAASLALLLARSSPNGALLVDLGGDVPAALGLGSADGPGIVGWLAAAPGVPPDALARIEEPVGPAGPVGPAPGGVGLGVIRRGSEPLPPTAVAAANAETLAPLLAADPRPVVVDCGRIDQLDGEAGLALAVGASRSLLVLRSCFLALRRARQAPVRPSGVILVAEGGRAITAADVEDALDVPVVCRVRVTDAIARAVDAGLLASHLPRSLARDLRHAA